MSQFITDLGVLLGMTGLSVPFLVVILLAGLLGWLSRNSTTGGIIAGAAVCSILAELLFRNGVGIGTFFALLIAFTYGARSAAGTTGVSKAGREDEKNRRLETLAAEIAQLEYRYFGLQVTPPEKETAGNKRARQLIACRITELYALTWLILNEQKADEGQLRKIVLQLFRWCERVNYAFNTSGADRKIAVEKLLVTLTSIHERLTEDLS